MKLSKFFVSLRTHMERAIGARQQRLVEAVRLHLCGSDTMVATAVG